jgi:hypothetical protein
MVPEPPDAGKSAADPAVTWHLVAVGATTEEFVADDVQAEAAIRKQNATASLARGTAQIFSNRVAESRPRNSRCDCPRAKYLSNRRRQLVIMIQ